MARRSNRERARALQERMRHAAAQVEAIFAAMNPEELAILMLPSRERTQEELGAAFAAHGPKRRCFKLPLVRTGCARKRCVRTGWRTWFGRTVWLRAREIRAVRARLEVEGRPVGKPSFETYYETEQAQQEATPAS